MTQKNIPKSSQEEADLHPAVSRTRRELKKEEPNKDGFCFTWGNCVRMRVSPSGKERALSIADLVLKEAERRGFKVQSMKKDQRGDVSGTCIVTSVRDIELVIREEMKRCDHEPTEEEESQSRSSSWYEPPKYEWRPTGNIFVVFEARAEPTVILKEGVRWRQEDRVPHIFKSLMAMVERAKEHDAELKRWDEEYEEKQKRIAQEAAEREKERQKVENLLKAIAAWQNAQGIRAFVSAAKFRKDTSEGSLESIGFDQWVEWALEYAERIDPLVSLVNCDLPG